ncbi:MAG TPA: glycosyltransferase [Myxococcota bacterium]|jgi:spore maturation protein CgeB
MPQESPSPAGAIRVLLVGSAGFDTVIDSYRRALLPHYDVRVFDPLRGVPGVERLFGPVWAARVGNSVRVASRLILREPLAVAELQLLRVAADFAPDLVLVSAVESLRPPTVAGLRSGNRSARVLGVFSDHIGNFERGYFFAADYDRLFFKDHFVVDKLRSKLGWKHVFYLPQCCDRQLHRRIPVSEEDRKRYGCDITLAGNAHLYRCEFLRPLIGRDLKVWGSPPPAWLEHPTRGLFTGRYVAGDEKCKAMLSASIVLNQNHYAEIAGTNKRTFEAAGVGAFQLTDTPALAEVFDPEREVAFFETQRDMLDRIDHYLARPELRAEMAERSRLRAHAEHTYEHRWAAQLETLGLEPPPGFPVRPGTLAVRAA